MKNLIILTKSRYVADQLSKSYRCGENGVSRIVVAPAVACRKTSELGIPSEYINDGYCYCLVEYKENADDEPYSFIVA